jgi:rhodanese-related sulfurtransferase
VALCADNVKPLLLDVREDWEVATAAIHIQGVAERHIPMSHIPERFTELDPAQPIVCICHHGMRSAQVGSFLERQGFSAIYNLAGGIDAWSDQIDNTVPRY